MKRDEIMKLTPDELRVEIAKQRGYELKHGFLDEACINPKDYWVTPAGRLTSVLLDWTTDIAAAYELEEELPDDNARHEYTKALVWVVNRNYDDMVDQRYQLIHATPAERSRAWVIWKTEAE